MLKIFGGARDSKVTDRITGQERRIANQFAYGWNIDFRQDLPDLKISGAGITPRSGNGETFRSTSSKSAPSARATSTLFYRDHSHQGHHHPS